MDKEKVKAIIRDSIHTALLIDDEYGNPFLDDNRSIDVAKEIHKSFRFSGHCLMDIYPYTTYEKLMEQKDGVFINHDLLILDWEMNNNKIPPYQDTLRLIDYVVRNTGIRYVVIYTNTQITEDILYQLIANFCAIQGNDRLKNELEEYVEDIINTNGLDIELDDIGEQVKEYVKGVLTNPSQKIRSASTAIAKTLSASLKINGGELCKEVNGIFAKYGPDANKVKAEFFKAIDLQRSGAKAVAEYERMAFTPVDSHSMRLNNTIITVINKSGQRNGVEANALYDAIVDKLMLLPNHRSLLFSLKLRTALHKELGKIGKSIGVIEEGALLHHAKTYTDENSLANYVSDCVACVVEDLIHRDATQHDYRELFADVEDESNVDGIINLNQLLTFTPASEMFPGIYKLAQGDVFKIGKPMAEKYNYLMCISAACDCARPDEKIAYNYAFALGKFVKPQEVLENVEKYHYAFIGSDKAIEWCKMFMTINMKNYEHFDINHEISVQQGADIWKMAYLGRMKLMYAQRVATMIFSNAHRIGVDLPKI